jgi:hypothetical protein
MNKKLLYLFLVLIFLKIIISLFIQFPLGYLDSLIYQETAKTFFETLSISNMAEFKYPYLYPLMISPAFLFEDMEKVFLIIKIINSILSSLIIFPVYLLSKEFFSKKKSFYIATICGFIPPLFIFTFTSMSENLFYPLFLFAIFMIYKAFKENSWEWNIFTGIIVGLAILTKILAVVLIPTIIFMSLFRLKHYPKRIILLLFTIIISSTLFIPRILNSGFDLGKILGYQASIDNASSSLFLITKIIWVFLYLDYLILASGIILFFYAILLILKYRKLEHDEKLFIQIIFFTTLFLIIICANHSGSHEKYTDYRTIGRYIEGTIPLFLILGFLQIQKKEIRTNTSLVLLSIFTIITTYFILFDKFFPINNSSLTHIGLIKYFLDSFQMNSKIILVFGVIILLIVGSLLIKKIKEKQIYKFILIYFFLITMINISIIFYDTQERWLTSEGAEIGRWINEKLDPNSKILFDQEELIKQPLHQIEINKNEKPIQIAAYWIRGTWKIGDISSDSDYIITKKDLDKEILYIGSSGTKVYKA